MNKKNLYLLLTLLAAGIFVGCFAFGKKPVNRYYLLDYIPTPLRAKQNKPPLPYTLRIKDMDVAEAYRRPEIVYRQSAHEMRFYNYHQWAVKPEHLISDMVFKHLRASNLFKSVTQTVLDYKPDFTLTGQIIALEEYDNREKWYAHLSITFQLEDNAARKQTWQKNYDVRKVVAQQEPVFVVRALSFLLEHTMDKVIEDLEAVFTAPGKRQAPAAGYNGPKKAIKPQTVVPVTDEKPESADTDSEDEKE